ncbi:hypothetical protein H9L15_07695 [Sphingomonas daechungensis]|uniref:Lipoprotein n=1 Tax=Sphingomonas daechungensis TaxID=1176646 RepID=A0ABX6T3M2_9SPHN|nr:DUF6491 family protein [Sphingomonas daechungensis]QNP42258.1 hypothetical protein H9L15_07695 [Sphingomonas daechungensis]
MIRSAYILIPLAALSALAAACAQQDAAGGTASAASSSSGRDCFNARNVSSFTPHGTDAVDIQVGVRRYYRLTFAGACQNINWVNRVALVSRSGSSFICSGMDAELIVKDSPMARNVAW